MTAGTAADLPVLELTGESTPLRVLLRDLRRHWRLLPVLARQDFAARYRSASLGLLWSVFLPLFQGAVLAVVFTHVVRIHTGVSYPVFLIAGMNAWTYFNTAFNTGATAIADTGALAGRVYFPRLLLPAMPAAANFPSLAIANVVLVLLMVVFGVPLTWRLVLLPVVMAATAVLAFGFAALAALAHVYFRDVRYLITAGLIIWFYGTPVIYPLHLAKSLQPLVVANPVTGIVQAVRWTVFGTAERVGPAVLVTLAWTCVLLVASLLAFRRHERIAVDRL